MTILKGRETNITRNLSEVEKQLGVDLKLNKDGDLELSNLGDIKLISGAENAGQALFLKLNIEPGGLIYHPAIGVPLRIGEKINSALDIKLAIIRSLRKDERFDDVRVKVDILGQTAIIDLRVTLSNTGKEVPLQFAIVN